MKKNNLKWMVASLVLCVAVGAIGSELFSSRVNAEVLYIDKNEDEINSIEEEKSDFGVILLGTGGPKSSEERSSPSALVYYKSDYFLVDMGEGTQDQLKKLSISTGDIETLMFTHHHLDHNEEYSGILITGWLKGRNHLNLIGPSGTEYLHDFTSNFYEEDMEYRASKKSRWSWNGIKENVDIKEITGDSNLNLNDVEIRTTDVIHTIDTQAYRFDVDGKSIVISGDLKYSENLIELAKDADVMVIDSGSVIKVGSKAKKSAVASEDSAHASLEEVALMASEANVSRLVLTHIVGDIDEELEIEELSKIFSGEIIIGEDLMDVGVE